MISLVLLLLSIPFVLPLVSIGSQWRLRARVRELEAQNERRQRDADELERRVRQLTKEVTQLRASAVAAERPRPEPPPPVVEPTPTKPAVEPPPPPVIEQPPPPVVEPPAQPVVEPPPPAIVPPRPRIEEPGPPPTEPARPTPPPAVPPRPARDVGDRAVAPAATAPFDWERLIGVRMFSAVAGVALVLAAVFFLRYSIDHGWLAPPIRVAIGIVTGIALLVVCELKAARRYAVTANALDAAAIAILFSTFFAAHALWQLIPAGAAFGLLALVTAVAVLLSIRRDSLFIAVLGLLGGFATPVLLSTGENRPIPLFAYVLLLNIGLAWVASRRRWPLLTILTLIFTTVYQWGWVIRFLTAGQLSLAMGIFLVFAIAGFVMTLAMQRGAAASGAKYSFERAGLAAAAMPLLFAVYLAAVPAYGARTGLLFGFLLIVDIGLLAATIARDDEYPHALGGLATLLVVAVWLAVSYSSGAWTTLIAFVVAFVSLYTAAPAISEWLRPPLRGAAERTVYAAPILLFVFPVIARIEPAAGHPLKLVAPLFALLGIIAWRAIAASEFPLYFVAAFFGVAAEAAWSVTHLTADHVRAATAMYTAFAVFYFGVPFIARRAGRALEPTWGGGAVLIASLILLLFLSTAPRPAVVLWGLALLLAILNAGVFIESAAARLPALSIVGGTLSWLVLASWWDRAAAVVGLLPSLLVLVGVSLTMFAGHAWAHAETMRRTGRAPVGFGFKRGSFLGLLGHLFLLLIAQQPEWALPPWPLFGALVVLTLAVTATSLAVDLSALHAAGVTAAAAIVLAWTVMSDHAWMWTSLAAAELVGAYALAGLVWRPRDNTVAIGAAVTLFVAELTLIAASPAVRIVPTAAAIVAHMANVSLVLALAWQYRWKWVAPTAALPAWLATTAWQDAAPQAWRSAFSLALALYAVFAAYPFVLGRRASNSRDPSFTAIAGSAFFFFAVRYALQQGGLDRFVGAVPIGEGAVLALLLRQLLRFEPAGSRDLGRLAVVAAAALGFATIAIPVQLRHQWITIGWALEGAALAWTYRRIPHRGLLIWAVALLAVVFIRLTLNPAVFVYEPRGARVFNWYLYTYAVCGAALIVAGWLFSTTDDRLVDGLPPASTLLPAAGVVVLFLLLNIEIADYYATGPEITFRFGVTLAQDLTYTIGWLLFGLALLTAGIYGRIRPARIASIALIAVTACKAFLYDMGSLGGLYRVVSLVGLALSLSLVALALQKFVLQPSQDHA